jgi:hypothetical protein
MTEPGPEPGDGGGPVGLQVTCRTLRRATELAYTGLIGLFVLCGLVLVLADIGRSVGPAVFGALFLGVSVFNGRTLLIATANELSFDTRSGIVRWRAPLRNGELHGSSIRAVRRDRRPGVYSFHCADGSHVEFWLTRRRSDVDEFFRVLGWVNASMTTRELYEPGAFWWKGLRPQG